MHDRVRYPSLSPHRACRPSQESVPRKRALQSYVSLVGRAPHGIPMSPATDPSRDGPEAFLSHLYLLKVGHRSPMIPTILLQTIYCIFDVQTSLLAQSRYLGSLWFRLGRKKGRKCEIYISNTRCVALTIELSAASRFGRLDGCASFGATIGCTIIGPGVHASLLE
jgi:hypothetical protein